MPTLEHPFSQKATVKKLTEHSAFLRLADEQEIEWDKTLLPSDVKEGDEVKLIVHTEETDEKERHKLAKEILNELFIEETK